MLNVYLMKYLPNEIDLFLYKGPRKVSECEKLAFRTIFKIRNLVLYSKLGIAKDNFEL